MDLDRFELNIKGCMNTVFDFDMAGKWLDRAEKELTEEQFLQLIRITLLSDPNRIYPEVFSRFVDKYKRIDVMKNGLKIINNLLAESKFEHASKYFNKNKIYLDGDEYTQFTCSYEQLKAEARKRISISIDKEVGRLVATGNPNGLRTLFDQNASFFDKDLYEESLLKSNTNRLKNKLLSYIENYEFDKLRKLKLDNEGLIDRFNMANLIESQSTLYLKKLLSENDLESMEEFTRNYQDFVDTRTAETLIWQCKMMQVKNELENLIESCQYQKAYDLYLKNRDYLADLDFSESVYPQLNKSIAKGITTLHFKFASITQFDYPSLDSIDLELCVYHWYWNRLPPTQLKNFAKLVREHYSSEYNLGRLLSARAAERTAIEFYRNAGFSVKDVSISQADGDGDEWKKYDLIVDDAAVDVKNSRRALNSPGSYSEHCVARFKQDRTGSNIRILGVLSDYLQPRAILDREQQFRSNIGKTIVLGETSKGLVEKLRMEFDSDVLDVTSILLHRHEGQFLPAWLFDYPENIYKKRDFHFSRGGIDALLDFFNLMPSQVSNNALLGSLPYLVVAREKTMARSILDYEAWGIYVRLISVLSRLPSIRAVIYLFVLSDFLMRLQRHEEINMDAYRKLLFFNDTQTGDVFCTLPLLRYDPLSMIFSLINVLSDIYDKAKEFMLSFHSFRLQGPNILKGKAEDGRWYTIIAYCGGWDDVGRCGRNPIYIGDSNICVECGHLICPVCEYCNQVCSSNRNLRSRY